MNEEMMKMLSEYGIGSEKELDKEFTEAVSQVEIGIMASEISNDAEKTA